MELLLTFRNLIPAIEECVTSFSCFCTAGCTDFGLVLPILYSFKHNQQDATSYNILYYCQCSTCFRLFLRPSSGAQKL